jgi:alkyldihydroxyacetonephosphate synthase
MKRWNGWGDDAIEFALGDDALAFLGERLGAGVKISDATQRQACDQLQPTRLPWHPLVDISPPVRLANALGQSLPDWLRMRHGRIDTAPDGVAFPESGEQVRELLDYAAANGALVIPCGGATSVAGHITAPHGDTPVLTINMTRMRAMLNLDAEAQLATFQAGVFGPDLEAQLRAHGYTLGHFPQSFEYSTLGGWVVTRSSGQQSLRYGRIEQLFAGGRLESPAGRLDVQTFPASAAGTDLREIVLGSEGRLGVLTEATVRVSPLPDYEAFHAVFFPDWEAAAQATRIIAQANLPLSMLRLSNALETTTMLTLAGHKRLVGALETYLGWRGCSEGKCMLMVGASGGKGAAKAALRAALALASKQRGVHVGRKMGDKWKQNRFRNVYLRNTAWQHGYAIDTVETAVDWPGVTGMMQAVEQAATEALAARGESPVRILRRRPGTLARAQGRSIASHRRQRRHHQPPARRGQRPRRLSRSGKRAAGHWRHAGAVPPF